VAIAAGITVLLTLVTPLFSRKREAPVEAEAPGEEART
jgi:hypothetical protein